MLFVGIDLAWSPRNNSGIAVLKGSRNKAELTYVDMSEIYHQFTNWWTKSKSFFVGGIFLSMLKIRQGVSEANMPPVY